MKRFFCAAAAAVLFFTCFGQVEADEYFSETIPLEIALLYHKMTDTPPDFVELAKQSPVYLNAPELGKDILLEDQRRRLEVLYYAMTKTTPITVVDNFSIEQNPEDSSVLQIKEMNEDLNYIYDLGGKSYIVFIRNYDVLHTLNRLKSEERFLFVSQIKRGIKVGAEIVIKPVTADIKPFEYKGEKMSLILADIALLRLIDNTTGETIKQYEPIKEPPKPSKMDRFFHEVIKQRRASGWDFGSSRTDTFGNAAKH